jgi:hypothetical protein
MPNGRIRVRTLVKFLTLYGLARDRRRSLTADEVAQAINCSKGHAYNYVRALDRLLQTQLDT